MKKPEFAIISDECIKSKPLIVYYREHGKDKAVVGSYCMDIYKGEVISDPYWVEEQYGEYIQNVYGWSDIPEPENN